MSGSKRTHDALDPTDSGSVNTPRDILDNPRPAKRQRITNPLTKHENVASSNHGSDTSSQDQDHITSSDLFLDAVMSDDGDEDTIQQPLSNVHPSSPPSLAQAVPSVVPVVEMPEIATIDTEGSPVPQPRVKDGPCPIDWSKVTTKYAYQREVYELRAPWLFKPQSFNEMVSSWNESHRDDQMGNPESIRKRFRSINVLVFKATGIFFVDSCMGLEKLVPLEHQKAGPKEVVRREADKVDDDPPNEETEEEKEEYLLSDDYMDNLENEGVDMFFIYYRIDDDLDTDPETAFIKFPLEVYMNASKTLTEIAAEKHGGNPARAITVEYARKVVERWLMCVGTADRPKFRLPFKLGAPEEQWSSSELFQLYSFSIWMGSPAVADMIMDHWHSNFRRKALLEEGYRTGTISFNNVPTEQFIHALDFEPEDINELWDETERNDPGRNFWLDVIFSKFEDGSIQVLSEPSSYEEEFLVDLVARLNRNIATKDPTRMDQLPCARYHLHTALDRDCYRSDPRFPRDPVRLINRVPDVHPSKAVKMTIKGVDYMILNNTDYSAGAFREIPLSFPDWQWERVRSVYNMNGGSWLPKVSYFHDNDVDEMGRYPSHPGYRNPEWKSQEQLDAERLERGNMPEGVYTADDWDRDHEDEEDLVYFQKDPFEDLLVDGKKPHWTTWTRLTWQNSNIST